MSKINSIATPNPTRRRLLKASAGLVCTTAFPSLALASTGAKNAKQLAFMNLHTNEKLNCCYWYDGEYDSAALQDINHVLRDHRSGDAHDMDPQLLDLLFDVQHKLHTDKPYQIISGYRSPATNKKLSKNDNEVAKKSLHMQGKAIDLRIDGIKLTDLRDTAITMKRGGVGYYKSSQFVHLDTGRPRSW